MIELIQEQVYQGLWRQLNNCIESEVAEEFLQTLLTLMKIMFVIQPDYRRNIVNFNGRYQFASKDGEVTVAAIFGKNRMKVVEGTIKDPNITVTFRSGKALLNFLLSPKQDILISMLNREIQTNGNLNYISKFGYMSKRLLQLMPRL
ncbi:hypothetical protein [Desulforhopalus sp. IMCC35007]|uniref:hypothetical protein n=1 Tax=Desulforhopalus sp. IMCC35007 TaxID=2569543 RepID=UPI0010AEB1F5|nr:hypothetical protein [Desulforhopalus sp. IMCC35007]TKB06158.1 hypothetical protein FCL48_22100 [Desulforhopalus sp. IMCC35007]